MVFNPGTGGKKPELQSKTVTPTAAGQTVTPDSNYDGLSSVVINGDSALTAANVKSGVKIFDVTGTYAPSLQSKTVTPTKAAQTVKPDSAYDGLSQVTVNGDNNLVADNIKSGVSIFGVAGSYDGGSTQMVITSTNSTTGVSISSGTLTITGLNIKPIAVQIVANRGTSSRNVLISAVRTSDRGTAGTTCVADVTAGTGTVYSVTTGKFSDTGFNVSLGGGYNNISSIYSALIIGISEQSTEI